MGTYRHIQAHTGTYRHMFVYVCTNGYMCLYVPVCACGLSCLGRLEDPDYVHGRARQRPVTGLEGVGVEEGASRGCRCRDGLSGGAHIIPPLLGGINAINVPCVRPYSDLCSEGDGHNSCYTRALQVHCG